MSRKIFLGLILLNSSIFNFACTQNETLQVRAKGQGFYWYFTYPGLDGKFDTQDDVVSDKRLQLPIGQPAIIEVTSEDYIYMFRANKLNIKEVAVPGMTFNVEFTPNQTGEYELIVDPMCGFNFMHDNKYMGFLHITSNENFKQWLSENT